MWGRGGRRGVERGGEKEGGRDTDMQSFGCHLAFSVRAVFAGKNGRLPTDVVQSHVSDDDDGGHTWPGDRLPLDGPTHVGRRREIGICSGRQEVQQEVLGRWRP